MPKKDSVNKDASGFIEDFAAALQNDNIITLLGKIFDDKFKSMIDIVNRQYRLEKQTASSERTIWGTRELG